MRGSPSDPTHGPFGIFSTTSKCWGYGHAGSSLILYGSGMSDANSHNHDPLPILLAGKAGGAVKINGHVRQPQLTPMSNLLLGILGKLGCPDDSFGDSTGRLAI